MALNDEDLRTAFELEAGILKANGVHAFCGCNLNVLATYPFRPLYLVNPCVHMVPKAELVVMRPAQGGPERVRVASSAIEWVTGEGLLVARSFLRVAFAIALSSGAPTLTAEELSALSKGEFTEVSLLLPTGSKTGMSVGRSGCVYSLTLREGHVRCTKIKRR